MINMTQQGDSYSVQCKQGFIFDDDATEIHDSALFSKDKSIIYFTGAFNDIQLADIKLCLYHSQLEK